MVVALLTAVAMGASRRLGTARARAVADDTDHRLDALERRVDVADQAAAELRAQSVVLSERQTSTEAVLGGAELFASTLDHLALRINGHTAAVEALSERVERLERRLTALQHEVDDTGALAATAVAASEETGVLIPSLRELRGDLTRLAGEVQAELEVLERTTELGHPTDSGPVPPDDVAMSSR